MQRKDDLLVHKVRLRRLIEHQIDDFSWSRLFDGPIKGRVTLSRQESSSSLACERAAQGFIAKATLLARTNYS